MEYRRARYTLHELGLQQNGERRWSIVRNNSEVAYLTTDAATAERIVRLLNANARPTSEGHPHPRYSWDGIWRL